ncbi:uncharacterized protein LOC132735671 [Ruditapes philippinarum]|uniref:uncharacterized protein LOC132735671 n=1 Tax=Ruditapes philippinarum TaxID=129788 RepID=UPI00295A9D9D|nr:uncharacterized protein LOC132735671 [Ruditapes philippinarum]
MYCRDGSIANACLLVKAPCPPPFFYSEFGDYALNQNLSRTKVCEIATRCMNRFWTENSTKAINEICNPQTTVPPQTTMPPSTITTTTTTVPPSTTTTTTVQPSSSTTSSSSTTTPPGITTEQILTAGSTCNVVCIILIVLLLVAVATAIVLIWKFKCYRRCLAIKWKIPSSFRKRSDRHKLCKQHSEDHTFENPYYSKSEQICIISDKTQVITARVSEIGIDIFDGGPDKVKVIAADVEIEQDKYEDLIETDSVSGIHTYEVVNTHGGMETLDETSFVEETVDDKTKDTTTNLSDINEMDYQFERPEQYEPKKGFETNDNGRIENKSDTFDKEEIIDDIGKKEIIDDIDKEEIIDDIDKEEIIEDIGKEEIIDDIGKEEIIDDFGERESDVTDSIGSGDIENENNTDTGSSDKNSDDDVEADDEDDADDDDNDGIGN